MRKLTEKQTLEHIATYINKRKDSHGMTLERLFDDYESDKDGFMNLQELTTLLKELKINVNKHLLVMVLAIFDHNKDNKIS